MQQWEDKGPALQFATTSNRFVTIFNANSQHPNYVIVE